MKKIITSLLIIHICFFETSHAQSIPRHVVSLSGSTFSNNNLQITFTVGEVVTGIVGNGDLFITQGFQQPGEQLQASNLVNSSVCPQSQITVPFNAIDFGSGNIYTVQLSDSSGSFSNPINIGTLNGNTTSGVISSTIPIGTQPGNHYRVRVSGSYPPAIGNENVNDITIGVPTTISRDIAPLTQTLLLGTSLSFPLSFESAGVALNYSWYKNNINSNTGGNLINNAVADSFTPPNDSVGTKYYYSTITGACGAISTSAAAVVITNLSVWKGRGTTNWSEGSNWTLNVVPGATNDAIIPAANTPYPILSANTVINNLAIDSTADVGIGPNTFVINGSITGTGTLSGGDTSSLSTHVSTSVRFTIGKRVLKNLNVNNGILSLATPLDITGGYAPNTSGVVTVLSGATLATFDNLTLQSNLFGTASLASGNPAGNYISGNISVERYIPNNGFRSWRLLSVPTYGTAQTIRQAFQEGDANPLPKQNNMPGYGAQITGTGTLLSAQGLGFDDTAPAASLLSWNGSGWIGVTSTNISITTRKGYFLFIRGERSKGISGTNDNSSATTLRTKGRPYQGDQPALPISANGFELIGNVYPSAIDFTKLIRTGGVNNTFYIWDSKKMLGTSLGTYQTFSATNGFQCLIEGGSYIFGQPNVIIESGQAFLVQAGNNPGTISLTENSKISSPGNLGFRPIQPVSLRCRLIKKFAFNDVVVDGADIVFNHIYSKIFGPEDAAKLINPGENFAVKVGAKLVSIEGRGMPLNGDTIPFMISNLKKGYYKWSFLGPKLENDSLDLWLEDSYLNRFSKIEYSQKSMIEFAVTDDIKSFNENRFRLFFQRKTTALIEAQGTITIFPIPLLAQGKLNVGFNLVQKGNYIIRLLSRDGKVIRTKSIFHPGGENAQYSIETSGITNLKGSFIEVTNDNGVHISRFIF